MSLELPAPDSYSTGCQAYAIHVGNRTLPVSGPQRNKAQDRITCDLMGKGLWRLEGRKAE